MAAPTTRDPDAGKRLRLALDLFEAGEQLMRANLRRRHPGASDAAEAEALLRDHRTRGYEVVRRVACRQAAGTKRSTRRASSPGP